MDVPSRKRGEFKIFQKGILGSWKKRFVVLEDEFLDVYEMEHLVLKSRFNLKGCSIVLDNSEEEINSQKVILLWIGGKESTVMSANENKASELIILFETERIRKSWIEHINQHISYANFQMSKKLTKSSFGSLSHDSISTVDTTQQGKTSKPTRPLSANTLSSHSSYSSLTTLMTAENNSRPNSLRRKNSYNLFNLSFLSRNRTLSQSSIGSVISPSQQVQETIQNQSFLNSFAFTSIESPETSSVDHNHSKGNTLSALQNIHDSLHPEFNYDDMFTGGETHQHGLNDFYRSHELSLQHQQSVSSNSSILFPNLESFSTHANSCSLSLSRPNEIDSNQSISPMIPLATTSPSNYSIPTTLQSMKSWSEQHSIQTTKPFDQFSKSSPFSQRPLSPSPHHVNKLNNNNKTSPYIAAVEDDPYFIDVDFMIRKSEMKNPDTSYRHIVVGIPSNISQSKENLIHLNEDKVTSLQTEKDELCLSFEELFPSVEIQPNVTPLVRIPSKYSNLTMSEPTTPSAPAPSPSLFRQIHPKLLPSPITTTDLTSPTAYSSTAHTTPSSTSFQSYDSVKHGSSSNPTLCFGWMTKQGRLIPSLRKCFFVLKRGVLSYYADDINRYSNCDKKPDPIGSLEVYGYEVVIENHEHLGGKLQMSLQPTHNSYDNRKYVLFVENFVERDMWVKALSEHVLYRPRQEC